jgi:hypothetical protein
MSNNSFYFFYLQNDYFQDDLFPPTKVLWEPTMTASQWFGGANLPPKRMDLKPNDMETRKSFDFAHQISSRDAKRRHNKYPFVCLPWSFCSFQFEGSVDDAISHDGSSHRRADRICDQRRRRHRRRLLIRCQRAQRA